MGGWIGAKSSHLGCSAAARSAATKARSDGFRDFRQLKLDLIGTKSASPRGIPRLSRISGASIASHRIHLQRSHPDTFLTYLGRRPAYQEKTCQQVHSYAGRSAFSSSWSGASLGYSSRPSWTLTVIYTSSFRSWWLAFYV